MERPITLSGCEGIVIARASPPVAIWGGVPSYANSVISSQALSRLPNPRPKSVVSSIWEVCVSFLPFA